MADPQNAQVALVPTPWNEEAARLLADVGGNSPTYGIGDLEREIMTGTATLYRVTFNRAPLGYVVLWVEDFGKTKELVIQSGKALSNDDEAVAVTIPLLEQFGRSMGCLSMRAHSNDRAMIRRLKKHGFGTREMVVGKVL